MSPSLPSGKESSAGHLQNLRPENGHDSAIKSQVSILYTYMEEILNARQKIMLFDYYLLNCRFIEVCEKMLFLCDNVTSQFD